MPLERVSQGFKDISGSLVYVSLLASLGGVIISWLVGALRGYKDTRFPLYVGLLGFSPGCSLRTTMI